MRRRQKKGSSGALWWALGLMVVGGGAAAVYAASGSAAVPDAVRGFRYLPNCGGVEVLDDAKMRAFVRDAGRRATKLSAQPTPAEVEAFAREQADALGGDGVDCDPKAWKTWPADTLVAIWDIVAGYYAGAVEAGRLSQDQGNTLAAALRSVLLAAGAPADRIPEALP